MGSRLEQKSSLVRKRIENHEFNGEDGKKPLLNTQDQATHP